MKEGTLIILTGLKHSGKSTLGAIIARRLGFSFRDTDSEMCALSGKTPRALYDEGGSELMARAETAACRHLVSAPAGPGMVIATGGGISDNPEAFAILREAGICVFVDAPEEVLYARIEESARRDGRYPPFLQGSDPRELFHQLFNRRRATYATMAHILIDAGQRRPDEIAQEIIDRIQYEQRTPVHC